MAEISQKDSQNDEIIQKRRQKILQSIDQLFICGNLKTFKQKYLNIAQLLLVVDKEIVNSKLQFIRGYVTGDGHLYENSCPKDIEIFEIGHDMLKNKLTVIFEVFENYYCICEFTKVEHF